MGCREGVDTDDVTGPCPAREQPFRRVTPDAFWIDQVEVTKGAYRRCMEAGVCVQPDGWDQESFEGVPGAGGLVAPGDDDYPAAGVS